MSATVFFMPDYQHTLDYLFARLPMFSRIGSAAYKADLHNTIQLCTLLGNPQNKFKTIHVAGTNGKGSTSHTVAAILQAAGYKTGLYTSPHLHDFRERIRVNGEMAEDAFVIDFTERLKPFIEEKEPSFFEITVGMAFEYFAICNVDIAVIETGLGGRLDSTNVITPILSVITNIGYDHVNILGDTLPKIAFEKAGIIKKGVPVVIGETLAETKPVFLNKAAAENAPIYFAYEKRCIADWEMHQNVLLATIADTQTDERKNYSLSLLGLYQLKNLLTVLEAIHQLKLQGFNISEPQIADGLLRVKKLTGLEGRWQVIHQKPYTVLDVGHNEDGIKQIIEQLHHCTFAHLHIVIGLVKDKDVSMVLSQLPKHATYYFTKAQIPRALSEILLMEQANEYGLNGHTYPSVNEALQAAVSHSSQHDMILVCGSVFVVGDVNAELIRW